MAGKLLTTGTSTPETRQIPLYYWKNPDLLTDKIPG
jgi:hypothetical protein